MSDNTQTAVLDVKAKKRSAAAPVPAVAKATKQGHPSIILKGGKPYRDALNEAKEAARVAKTGLLTATVELKKLIILLIFFLFTTSANAQYVIDWENAPLNPIPFVYTANHLNIKGPVITRKSDGLGVFTFRASDFVKSFKSPQKEDQYIYAKVVQLSRIESSDDEVSFGYNDNFQLVRISKRKEELELSYNPQGLFTQVKDTRSGNIIHQYKYDSDNRIERDEYYENGIIFSMTVYIYKKLEKGLEVKIAVVKGKNDKEIKINIYNERGHCISQNGTPINYTYDKDKNIITREFEGRTETYQYDYPDLIWLPHAG